MSFDGAWVARLPRGLRSKEKLLRALAERLRFPGYFGGNWDALEECLRDLSWLPAGRKVVIVHDDVPFTAGGTLRGTYLAILRSAVEFWRTNAGRDFEVVFPAARRGEIPRVGGDF